MFLLAVQLTFHLMFVYIFLCRRQHEIEMKASRERGKKTRLEMPPVFITHHFILHVCRGVVGVTNFAHMNILIWP